jgi:hypothetical protein
VRSGPITVETRAKREESGERRGVEFFHPGSKRKTAWGKNCERIVKIGNFLLGILALMRFFH